MTSTTCGCGGNCACHGGPGAFRPPCSVPGGCGSIRSGDVPTQRQQQPATGDLWKWVDRLTRDRRQRLVRRAPGMKERVEYVDVPSLWTQLVEAQASTNAGGGKGKASTGSRAPLDLAITSFMAEVQADVVRALRELGSPARIEITERGTVCDLRAELRHLPAVVVSASRPELVDRWAGRYRRWVARAEEALTIDDEESVDLRGVRGHACPTCRALWVTSERDGELYRDAALVIAFRDGQVQHVTCRACGTGWWRGDDVDELTRQLASNEAIWGDARRWGDTVERRMGV